MIHPKIPVHDEYFCDGCEMHPIVGLRYHCLSCEDYDLCENCYNREVHKFHHLKEMDSKSKIEKKYSYQSIPPTVTVKVRKHVREEYELKLKLKNDYIVPWKQDSTILSSDEVNSDICLVEEISLPPITNKEIIPINCRFLLENLEEGEHKALLNFKVDDIIYGEPLTIIFQAEEFPYQKEIKSMRSNFLLKENIFPDKVLIEALNQVNGDLYLAFQLIYY